MLFIETRYAVYCALCVSVRCVSVCGSLTLEPIMCRAILAGYFNSPFVHSMSCQGME